MAAMASIFELGYLLRIYLTHVRLELTFQIFPSNRNVRVQMGFQPEACPFRVPNRHALARNQKVNRSGEVLKITWPLITHKHSRFGSHEVHTKILYRQSYLISVTENSQNCFKNGLKSANLNLPVFECEQMFKN